MAGRDFSGRPNHPSGAIAVPEVPDVVHRIIIGVICGSCKSDLSCTGTSNGHIRLFVGDNRSEVDIPCFDLESRRKHGMAWVRYRQRYVIAAINRIGVLDRNYTIDGNHVIDDCPIPKVQPIGHRITFGVSDRCRKGDYQRQVTCERCEAGRDNLRRSVAVKSNSAHLTRSYHHIIQCAVFSYSQRDNLIRGARKLS